METSESRLLLTVAAVVVLVVASVYTARSKRQSAAAQGPPAVLPALPSVERAVLAAPSATEQSPIARRVPVEPSDTPRSPFRAYRVALAGQVALPRGAPDNALRGVAVLAKAADYEHRAFVDEEGRFELPWPTDPSVRKLKLVLESSALVLENEAVAEIPGEIVLEPSLGGTVVGRLIVPLEAKPEDFHLSLVRRGDYLKDEHSLGPVGDDWTFRLAAPRGRYDLVVASPYRRVSRSLDVVPGEPVAVVVEVSPGATVTGRVLSRGGLPVSRASVRAILMSVNESWNAELDRHGNFRIGGISPGEIELCVTSRRYVTERFVLGHLGDGDTRFVDVVLEPAERFSGRVFWADGEPAERARVRIEASGGGGVTRSRHSGRFTLYGVRGPVLRVSATGRLPDSYLEVGEAQATVPPGDTGIVLTLSDGWSLSGRVVDEDGRPVPRFRLAVKVRDRWGGPSSSFHAPEGTFALHGLPRGSVEVRIESNGETSPPMTVAVPGEDVELVLRD